MHAALFVLANVISNTTPLPTQLVLDGCNTASAIRAAEIRLTAPAHPTMRALLDDILAEPDGVICLLESEVLVSLHRVGHVQDLVIGALAVGLATKAPHVAARAAELAAKIRGFDPAGYDELLRRVDAQRGSWRAFTTGPAPREDRAARRDRASSADR